MRRTILIVMFAAVLLALYEQSKSKSNIWITVVALVVFMMGMMWLSSKTPSKNNSDDKDDAV